MRPTRREFMGVSTAMLAAPAVPHHKDVGLRHVHEAAQPHRQVHRQERCVGRRSQYPAGMRMMLSRPFHARQHAIEDKTKIIRHTLTASLISATAG